MEVWQSDILNHARPCQLTFFLKKTCLLNTIYNLPKCYWVTQTKIKFSTVLSSRSMSSGNLHKPCNYCAKILIIGPIYNISHVTQNSTSILKFQ